MLNRLCGKRFAVAMILCLTMVFSVPSGAVFADTGADSAQDSAWNQFSKIENITDGTIRGVDLSMYPGFPNNHTSLQESSNNYYCFGRASSGLTPRSRYSCSCFVRTSPCTGAFPGSR